VDRRISTPSSREEVVQGRYGCDRPRPARCRASVAERYDVDVVTTAYEAVYRRINDAVGRARLGGRAALRSPPDIG
jgi:hypothetical protein